MKLLSKGLAVMLLIATGMHNIIDVTNTLHLVKWTACVAHEQRHPGIMQTYHSVIKTL